MTLTQVSTYYLRTRYNDAQVVHRIQHKPMKDMTRVKLQKCTPHTTWVKVEDVTIDHLKVDDLQAAICAAEERLILMLNKVFGFSSRMTIIPMSEFGEGESAFDPDTFTERRPGVIWEGVSYDLTYVDKSHSYIDKLESGKHLEFGRTVNATDAARGQIR